MDREEGFWRAIDQLLSESEIKIDRPRGSAHPRYADMIYPLDYGYLIGTVSGDGDGIDVWLGSAHLTAIGLICTVDLLKRDMESKLLLGCTPEDVHMIETFIDELGIERAPTMLRPPHR